ncbi:zinc ABC transporter substrate-binding protein [Phaeovulum sp.]|uniref:zinc ABC transporter substrate-binding protein n=1 Tax=Phaeovulum sp. TaxID=2934796 RepID=UPI00356AF6C3
MRHPRLSLAAATAFIPSFAFAAPPVIITDVAVVQSLVEIVLGDVGTADVLLPPGASAHSYQLRPSQAAALQRADLVFWVGERLSPWLGRTVEGAGLKGHSVALLDAPGTHLRLFDEQGAHDHEAEADAGHDEHDHEGLDPHAWLDPANGSAWLAQIAAELAAADPANAATYAANAAAGAARLQALDSELAATLAPIADRPFVVPHDAYGYFADHYGLHIAGALNEGDASAPGAAHLTELRAELTAGGIVCAFPEAGHDQRQLALILEGTPVRAGAELDPTGSMLDAGPGLYEALLRGLASALTDCLMPR